MNLSFDAIQVFLALAEGMNFSQAARALSLSQPSVSRQVKALEDLLECQLFIRDTHRVALTEQGRRLFERLKPSYQEIVHAVEDMRDKSQELRGCVTIGTLDEFGRSLLTPAMLAFQRQNPRVSLDIRFLEGFRIIDDMKSGRFDLAIVPLVFETENLRCFPLFKEEVVLVTRSENTTLPEDYDQRNPAPFVLYRPNDYMLAEFFRQSEMRLRHWMPYVCVNSQRSMIEALLQCDSFGVLPQHAIKTHLEEGKLKLVHPFSMTNTFYLVHPTLSHAERRISACKKFLVEHFGYANRV